MLPYSSLSYEAVLLPLKVLLSSSTIGIIMKDSLEQYMCLHFLSYCSIQESASSSLEILEGMC